MLYFLHRFHNVLQAHFRHVGWNVLNALCKTVHAHLTKRWNMGMDQTSNEDRTIVKDSLCFICKESEHKYKCPKCAIR